MVWGHPEGRQAPPLTLSRGYCVPPESRRVRVLPTSSPEAPCPACQSHPSPSHSAELPGRTRGLAAHPEGRLPQRVQLPCRGPASTPPARLGQV